MKTYWDIAGGSVVLDQVVAQGERLRARMAAVRRVVAVMSGKGGVGKSAVTVGLASALARRGAAVGIADADINGPSIAKMTGIRGQRLAAGPDGVVPALAPLGLKVMSMDLFLPDDRTPVVWDAPTQRDAHTWRGLIETAALRELLADTEWGSLDVLFIDLPPGSDRVPTLLDLLGGPVGVVVVTLPSGLSRLVVGRAVEMARGVEGAELLGVVENMGPCVCPHCGEPAALFPAAEADSFDIPLLGRIPFDPRLAAASDAGLLFLEHHPDAPAACALREVAESIFTTASKRGREHETSERLR